MIVKFNMIEDKSLIELIESFEKSFKDILKIMKSMGNDNRLKILSVLLTGEKSFEHLKSETALQKTALSNHLTKLINNGLVEKPEHGKYKITSDGNLFVKAVDSAFYKSDIWKKKQTEKLERRQFSEMFVESFFGRE